MQSLTYHCYLNNFRRCAICCLLLSSSHIDYMAYKSKLLYEREHTCDFGDFVNRKDLYSKIQVQRPVNDIQSFQSGAGRFYAMPKVSSTLVSLELASTEALH